MTKIGFIGVGNMGGPMARNLVQAGHEVAAFDLDEEKLNLAVQSGARRAGSISDAVAGAEAVVTMLPAGQHVRAVYTGDDGVIASVAEGTLLIDSSTIDVDSSRAAHAAAEAAGYAMIDAPVSGGVGGAEAGTLTFMCGGAGAGQVAKICNNMILGAAMIVTGEAFSLAERLGLDAQSLFDIVATASGQTWALTSYCPVPGPVPTSPANRDYRPGFTVEMMAKDLRLAQDAAQGAKLATPIGAAALATYSLFENAGNAQMDFSGIIKMIQGQG